MTPQQMLKEAETCLTILASMLCTAKTHEGALEGVAAIAHDLRETIDIYYKGEWVNFDARLN